MELAGAAREPSALVAIACRVPRFNPKSAGANWFTWTAIGWEAVPARFTTTFAWPVFRLHGTCALIWPPETNTRGAAAPLIVTEVTSPRVVDTGTELDTDSPEASPVPKIEISEPGATSALCPEPAAFT